MNFHFKLILIIGFLVFCNKISLADNSSPLKIAETQFQTGDYKSTLLTLTNEPNSNLKNELQISAYIKTGQFSQADSIIKTLKDSFLIKNYRSLVLQNKGLYQDAIDELNDINLTKVSNSQKYEVYKNLGVNYWLQGNINQAEHYLKDYHENFLKSSKSYNNLGLVYLESSPERAIELFKEGLSQYKSNDFDITKLSLNNNLGIAYKNLKQNDLAFETFNESLKLIQNKLLNTPIHAFILNNQAQLIFDKKDPKKAFTLAILANSILKNYYTNKHPEISSSNNLLASFYLNVKNYDKAQEQIKESFQNNCNKSLIDITAKELYTNLMSHTNQRLTLETMILQAEYFEHVYYYKNPKLIHLKNALNYYVYADSMLVKIRNSSLLEADKLNLNKAASKLYDNAITTTLKIYEFDLNKKLYFQIAYQFSEKNKSSILLEAINESKSKKFAGIPDQLLKTETELKSKISFYELNKMNIPNASIILEKLYQQNNAFLKDLELKFPKYFELKYTQKVLNISTIQKQLSDKEAILNYHISDNTSLIVCFVIEKNKTKIFSKTKDDLFEKKIIAFRNSINFKDIKTFIKTGNYLYQNLLDFKLPRASNFIIIPDSKLSTIPFEAIPNKIQNTNIQKYSDVNYLILKKAISYYYSSHLFLMSNETNYKYTNNALLCAPVNYKNGLSTLNGALDEVIKVDSVFKTNYYQTVTYTKNQATETIIKKSINENYKYIMISSHGLVNEMNPDKSEIFLFDDNENDGNLYANELYNQEINTYLFMLTCCQTGLGKISKGEGILGLSRALLYAGVQNMLVSLWNVSDKYSVQMSTTLIKQQLESQKNISAALQIAKINLIKNEESANPYYWSAYIVVGK